MYDIDLDPISTGFDPRAHDMKVLIPHARSLRVRYVNGLDLEEVTGPPDLVAAILRLGGYCTQMQCLTIIDPNDNGRARHQYLVRDWLLLHRRLPAKSVGDRWRDDAIDEPWWEPMLDLPPAGPIREHWESMVGDRLTADRYSDQATAAAGHVAAYAPNGREVRVRGAMYEVQPHNDNYWIACRTLAEARIAYFGGKQAPAA